MDYKVSELPLIVKELEEAIAFSILGIKEAYNSNRFLNKRSNGFLVSLLKKWYSDYYGSGTEHIISVDVGMLQKEYERK